ncbi:1,2-phenylacetyl-CoA epoxidase subunit PaaC [uncultured Psychrobacter sp.]|uniref:1,2-phenylacetyl-CoA epoxidase subunit PaaC n=1 Tax=uncultured Psychrobacter sp. TaxID=259303 RepID=UPI003458C214
MNTTAINNEKTLFDYALRLGDTTLILAQRHCEWVGHAPTIEEELALANIGLDTLGQAMAWLEVAAEHDEEKRDADRLAYFRNEREYTNYLLAELDKGDFAVTTLRGFFISTYFKYLYQEMQNSSVEAFKDIAIKSSKEVQYHYIHQRAWLVRLGNGTEESHRRLQDALNDLWAYTNELFEEDETIQSAEELGIISSMSAIKSKWREDALALIEEAGLTLPQDTYHHSGGTQGLHTETLGLMLAEMQSLRRQFPDAKW